MKRIVLFSLLLLSFVLLSHSGQALADAKGAIQCGVNAVANVDCSTAPSGTSITDLVKTIINVLSALAGAAAVIMLIVGGFRYVTSAGSETAVTGAKKTILYALVGLVVVAVAQIVVHFVLNNIGSSGTAASNSGSSSSGGLSGSSISPRPGGLNGTTDTSQ